jgi:glycerophosphoryl diester phosphodiesterase
MAGPGSGNIEIIAHRGYSAAAPENTLVALDRAVTHGAHAVEFDVQIASCGTPVLFHDVHLGRTTNGVGPVRRRTLEQLKALDAGSWFSSEFTGERIPSLAEALERVGSRVQRLYCEIKAYREMEDLDRIVSVSRSSGYMDRIVFISLDWIALDRVASQAPDHPIGYIVDTAEQIDLAAVRARRHGKAFVDAQAELLLDAPHLITPLVNEDIEIGVWTVNEPEAAERLFDMGVTRFTTNEVEQLVRWRSFG